MKKTCVLLMLLISVSGLLAQDIDQMNELLRNYQVEINQNRSFLEERVDGTPYLTEDYVTSQIYFKEKKKPLHTELRYNVYSDEFEFVRSGRLFAISNKEQIDSIEYQGKEFVYGEYTDGSGSIYEAFMHRMVKGDCALYKIYRVEFYEAEPPRTGYDEYKPPRFEEEDPLYCLKMEDDARPREIESFRRGKFLNRFGSLEPELKRYIKDQNIRLRKEEDLIRFLRYYNANY
ncbi:MAG: hypothetical protein KGY60_10880 [Bacteroidales bacterium]|nr:hypothetical protein [Bacteroidales bacterium]